MVLKKKKPLVRHAEIDSLKNGKTTAPSEFRRPIIKLPHLIYHGTDINGT